MTISAELLSGSTNGQPISVTATTSGGANTVHAAHATSKDEIWLWAVNEDTVDRKLTVEFGNATELIEYTVPAEDGLHLIVPGVRLSGSLVVKAFCDTTAVVALVGNVNRHS